MDKHQSKIAVGDDTNAAVENKPSPANFDEYIPWACIALQENFIPVITKSIIQDTNAPIARKGKFEVAPSATGTDATTNTDDEKTVIYCKENLVKIETVYSYDALIQLKFSKNHRIPRKLLKIISLILPFHPLLAAICIDSGLDAGGLYELAKIIAATNITEVILDNTRLKEANYYCLLEKECPLKYLSLARCNINDDALEQIASRLIYPSPASKTLSVLNLSSNIITDNGAIYLGEMLKTNRQLAYLNLADNRITDYGAETILNSLIEFPLTIDDMVPTRQRKFIFIQEKLALIKKTAEEMTYCSLSKNQSKFKSRVISVNASTMKKYKESKFDESIQQKNIESFTEVAEAIVESQMGPFQDPYSFENIVKRGDVLYCLGNNTLCYLSMAYNNISCLSVKKLYSVLTTQHDLNRNPKGLVNVCIEGNDISGSCIELERVNNIIENGLLLLATIIATPTKKKGK